MRYGFLATMFVCCVAGVAQTPAKAPAGSTGICKDGTYTTAASKSGACAGHKGVQTWYVASTAPAAATPAAAPASSVKSMPAPTAAPAAGAPAAPAPKPAVAAAPAAPATAAATSGKKLSPAEAAAQKTAAPGGGKGLVWVNTASNVYHCSDSAFYGKTKAGAYMSEADAKAKGAHAAQGQSCANK